MTTAKVSAFMLERYRLGELSPEDEKTVKEALAADETIRTRMEKLDESDRELRRLYPAGYFHFEHSGSEKPGPRNTIIPGAGKGRGRFVRIAAAAAVCILLSVIYLLQTGALNFSGRIVQHDATRDRAKGLAPAGFKLSVYLKGAGDLPLSDEAVLREGNTVQLAYTAPAGEHYGVIFSIDGRAAVTMHYPYRKGQSPLLVPGKHTFLSEAYTLDDAPGYEVFVMVVSGKPLNAEAVLEKAGKLAEKPVTASGSSGSTARTLTMSIEEKSRAVFADCDVETVSVLKE